jgi:hypothetical protein
MCVVRSDPTSVYADAVKPNLQAVAIRAAGLELSLEQHPFDLLRAHLFDAQDRHPRLPAGTTESCQLAVFGETEANSVANVGESAVVQGV